MSGLVTWRSLFHRPRAASPSEASRRLRAALLFVLLAVGGSGTVEAQVMRVYWGHNPSIEVSESSSIDLYLDNTWTRTSDLTVHYTVGGTADLGMDFTIPGCTASPCTFTLPSTTPPFIYTDFPLTIHNDQVPDNAETIILTLVDDNNPDYNLSNQPTLTITVYEDTGNSTFSIQGTHQVGQTLSVAQTDDPDGNGTVNEIRWLRRASLDDSWAALDNEHTPTYTLMAGDLNQFLRAAVKYTDGNGYSPDTIHTPPIGPILANTAPRITAITVQASSATAVAWRVVFDEAVINVDAMDFTVSGTSADLAVEEVSPTTYDVTASGGDLADLDEGTAITLRLVNSPDIEDPSGNSLTNTTLTGTWTIRRTAVKPPAPAVSASSATVTFAAATVDVTEGKGVRLTVNLDPPRPTATTVGLTYHNGTATDDDYRGPATVSIPAHATSQAFTLDALPDAVTEPDETVTVTLGTVPDGLHRGSPSSTTVTLRDHTPMARPTAGWLVRFARTMADQALEGLTQRLTAPRTPGMTGALAASDSLALADALAGSGLATTEPIHGGTLALWGRAHRSGFDGRALGAPLDGTVDTLQLGLDYARGPWLTGVSLLHSDGDGDWRQPATASGIRSTVTAVVPYGAWTVSDRRQVWGALGTGDGTVTRQQPTGPDVTADLSWQLVAAGATGALTGPGSRGKPALSWRAEALWSAITSKATRDLRRADTSVTRLRAGLDSRWAIPAARGGQWQPHLTAGLRHDGGDADNGLGLDLGAGITWADHHGLSLTVRRTLGPAEGDLEALFSAAAVPPPTDQSAHGHWRAEAAWGLATRSDRYTGSPHLGLGRADGVRDLTLGWRWIPIRHAHRPAFGVRAVHRNHGEHTEQVLGLEVTARW